MHATLDNNDIAIERYWRFAQPALFVALGLHAMFAVVFAILGVELLLWLNLVSMSIYIGSLALVARGMRMVATALVWTEVVAHALIATRILGWDSGFQYYMWILVPVVFFSSMKTTSRKLVLSGGVIGAYVLAQIWLQPLAPLTLVSSDALKILLNFNIACYLSASAFMAFIYARAVGETEKQLHALATTDALTGLINRRRMLEISEYELARARRHGRPVCAILLDIDYFKSVNDRFGHAVGDRVLTAIAQLLRTTVRTQDHVARWGGEEFLILMPEVELGSAHATAERVRLAIATSAIDALSRSSGTATSQPLRVTATLGISEWSQDEDFDHAIARADIAMYRGKVAGRNRTEVGQLYAAAPRAIAV